jgi:hypothetical protein
MLQPSGTDTGTEANVLAQERTLLRDGVVVALDPAWRAGRKLEAAREQLGLTLDQVSAMTRVRREFLEALEEMNAKLLPGKAYALAYLRSYVRLLGLEKTDIVEQFQREVALSREDALPQVRDPRSRPRSKRPWLPAAAVGVVAAGLIGWQIFKENFTSPDTVRAAVQTPTPSERPAPLAPISAPIRAQIEIRALKDEHLEMRGPDGTIYLYRTLRAGETYRPDAGPGWTVHARDGGAFEVIVDGAPAGLLGEAGKPVLGRRIDALQPTDADVAQLPSG